MKTRNSLITHKIELPLGTFLVTLDRRNNNRNGAPHYLGYVTALNTIYDGENHATQFNTRVYETESYEGEVSVAIDIATAYADALKKGWK